MLIRLTIDWVCSFFPAAGYNFISPHLSSTTTFLWCRGLGGGLSPSRPGFDSFRGFLLFLIVIKDSPNFKGKFHPLGEVGR